MARTLGALVQMCTSVNAGGESKQVRRELRIHGKVKSRSEGVCVMGTPHSETSIVYRSLAERYCWAS